MWTISGSCGSYFQFSKITPNTTAVFPCLKVPWVPCWFTAAVWCACHIGAIWAVLGPYPTQHWHDYWGWHYPGLAQLLGRDHRQQPPCDHRQQPPCARGTGPQHTVLHLLFFFLKFFLFLNFMLILGHDSVFSMTVASTRTRSFLEKRKRNYDNLTVHWQCTSPWLLPALFTPWWSPQRSPGFAMGSNVAQTDFELPLYARSNSVLLILLPLFPV